MSVARSAIALLRTRPGTSPVRVFLLAIAALAVALLLALYSGAAAELGQLCLASTSALAALAVAAWVAVTLVPVLARRTPLRWIGYKMEYRVTRAGWIYFGGILLVAMAALNTGNNLLFLVLACLIAIILMSGILSSIALTGVECAWNCPNIFLPDSPSAPTFNCRMTRSLFPVFRCASKPPSQKMLPHRRCSKLRCTFRTCPKRDRVQQTVPMTFMRRGVYRQDTFRIVTRFPFGFLQKARRLDMATEAVVYPSVAPSNEFVEILPGLQGALESLSKGRGQDLYALRDYMANDSVRHVHWKASARLGSLMVREFTREDDCRVLLVLDPHITSVLQPGSRPTEQTASERFERAVTLCAALTWHFYERAALLQFRSAGVETRLAPAEEIVFLILRHLAMANPLPPDPKHQLITDLAASPELFKIIVTSQPRGSHSRRRVALQLRDFPRRPDSLVFAI